MRNFIASATGALLFLLGSYNAHATHAIGAEFRYTAISEFTYQLEVIYYTKLTSLSDREELLINCGDGTADTIPRISFDEYPEFDLKVSIYSGTHTYPGYGNYTMTTEDPNRSAGINNIPGSVTIPLAVEALLVIDPNVGMNNSIRFDSLQTNVYWTWSTLIHEPGSRETDGDSTVYELVTPLGAGAMPIPGYVFPSATNYLWCNPETGRVLWDRPEIVGEFVIAIRGSEYRNGQLIGQVTRDMTIIVTAGTWLTGLNEIDNRHEMIIRPTLATDFIVIDHHLTGALRTQVFNISGQCVLERSGDIARNTVDVIRLVPGNYSVRTTNEQGIAAHGRFHRL